MKNIRQTPLTLLEDMIEVVREGRSVRNAGEGNRQREIEKTLTDLERRKRNLLLAIEDGTMAHSDVKGRLQELTQQIKVVSEDLQSVKTELKPLPPVKKWNLPKFRKQLLEFMKLD